MYERSRRKLISKMKDTDKTLIEQNIYIWMLQWILPTLLLQFFVIFGFVLTLEGFPLKKSVYTHPHEHGLIYKALKDLANEEQVTLVVDKSSILFGSAEIDLTDKLQQRVRGY